MEMSYMAYVQKIMDERQIGYMDGQKEVLKSIVIALKVIFDPVARFKLFVDQVMDIQGQKWTFTAVCTPDLRACLPRRKSAKISKTVMLIRCLWYETREMFVSIVIINLSKMRFLQLMRPDQTG